MATDGSDIPVKYRRYNPITKQFVDTRTAAAAAPKAPSDTPEGQARMAQQREQYYQRNPHERPEAKNRVSQAQKAEVDQLVRAAAAGSGYAQQELKSRYGDQKAGQMLFDAQNPELAGKVDYRTVNFTSHAGDNGEVRKIATGQTYYRNADGRQMGIGDAIQKGIIKTNTPLATQEDIANTTPYAIGSAAHNAYLREKAARDNELARRAAAANDLQRGAIAHANWMNTTGQQQNDAFRAELQRNGGITDQDVAERNMRLSQQGLPPFQPTPTPGLVPGMKKGGQVKTKTNQNKLRGVGIAQRGVKKLRGM